MKAIGIIRKVDELGRVVLPVELRREYEINEKDPMEIFVDGDCIVLKKYAPECTFCGEAKSVTNFKGKNICQGCRQELRDK